MLFFSFNRKIKVSTILFHGSKWLLHITYTFSGIFVFRFSRNHHVLRFSTHQNPRFDRVELVAILAAAVIAFRCKLVLAARRPEVGENRGKLVVKCWKDDWRRRHLLSTSLMWSAHSNWHCHGVPKAEMPGGEPLAAYDPDDLKHEILEAYVKSVGVENAFGFHCYKALPVSFAARGNDLVTMHKWVLAILTANPQGSLLVSKCL